jgi:hypothetical protein
MLTVKFFSLTGKFEVVRTEDFQTDKEAMAAVMAHATSGGYTNVKTVMDADSIRYTAKTPGGRGGRNVAAMDLF